MSQESRANMEFGCLWPGREIENRVPFGKMTTWNEAAFCQIPKEMEAGHVFRVSGVDHEDRWVDLQHVKGPGDAGFVRIRATDKELTARFTLK
jgi:hypothetical protein